MFLCCISHSQPELETDNVFDNLGMVLHWLFFLLERMVLSCLAMLPCTRWHHEANTNLFEQVSFSARQLMYRLLHRDPRNRLGSCEGANEIKQHPFFRGINWALVRCMVRFLPSIIIYELNNAILLSFTRDLWVLYFTR